MEEHIKSIYEAVLNYEVESVKQCVIEALENGIDPITVMDKGLSKAIIEIGDKFGREEIFLMELMIAAEACMSGMDIVKKKLLQSKVGSLKPKGVVVIGTVEGDIHNIGKDIVKTLLQTSGFEVHDIGVDQKADNFVQKAKEVNARIVASSALLTTTSPNQKAIEERLKEAGIRDKVKTIIGGAATNEDWAREVGCDFYASTATEGVNIIKKYFEGA